MRKTCSRHSLNSCSGSFSRRCAETRDYFIRVQAFHGQDERETEFLPVAPVQVGQQGNLVVLLPLQAGAGLFACGEYRKGLPGAQFRMCLQQGQLPLRTCVPDGCEQRFGHVGRVPERVGLPGCFGCPG